MGHHYTWDKLAKNAYRLNTKSRGPNYPGVPRWEISKFTSGVNKDSNVIVPYKGTSTLLISLRAWGVTQSSMHSVTLMFHEVEILTENPMNPNYFQIQYKGQMYWIKKLDKYRNPLTSRCTCFTGDTKVRLADGTSKTFKELEGKDFVVKSFKDGKFINCQAGNSSVKKQNADIIKLIFNNGSYIKCTPDHKFFLDDGSVVEAKDTPLLKLRGYDNDIFVEKIIPQEQEDVYCITVPETSNFVVETSSGHGINVSNCKDFFFTWAWYNHNAGCLYGPKPRPYRRKTTWAKVRNEYKIVGVCKHIYHAWKLLHDSGLTIN